MKSMLAATLAPASSSRALKDPVCGMTVTTESPHKVDHASRPYWFCSAGCRTRFLTEPQRYVALTAAPAEPMLAAAGTTYTCPM